MFNVNSAEYRQAATALNYEIEAVFRKNLKYFEDNEPDIYRLFKDYKPKKLRLKLAPEGYLNLFNIDTGLPVYPTNPLEYAKKQVEIHLESRPVFTLNLMLPENNLEGYPYTKCISKLDIIYDKITINVPTKGEKEVPHMFMFGGGLFLHLEPLLNTLDIKSLSIFESNHDSFYASAHLIDWSEIYKYFSQEGYSLSFNITSNDESDLHKIANIYYQKGFHNFPRIEQYFHYYNDEISNISKKIKSHLQTIIGSQGFFEDERIGLAHTLDNLKNNYPINSKNLFNDGDISNIPVIVVGNGPSLDKIIPLLKENKSNCLVVSSGSALSALLKNGIKPDIHVEQERMSIVANWLEESTMPEERKGISLVALNPCHPRTFKLFDSAYMALKPADLGTDLITVSGLSKYSLSYNCLPLVGNLALSVVLGLGFDRIFLAGIDCGMVDKENHHSEDSNYYNNEKTYSKDVIDSNALYGFLKVKGNLREAVTSTPMFSYSRIELESLLNRHQPNCYNLSDGAYIKGSKPLLVENFPKLQAINNKTEFVKKRLDLAFIPQNIDDKLIKGMVSDNIKRYNELIVSIEDKFDLKSLNMSELNDNFDTLELILKAIKISDPVVHRLINGSVRGIAYKMTVAKYNLSNEDFDSYFETVRPIISTFFKEMSEDMNENFYSYSNF